MPNDPIKHVIVLMLENNSFDHILGSLTQIKPIDGVPSNFPRANNYCNKIYTQTTTNSSVVSPDPKHDLKDTLTQIEKDEKGIEMGGFVKNYAESYKDKIQTAQFGQVMNYYALNGLPVMHQLASQFTICDHWFSSLPGPTWPNRLFAMSGTSLGRTTMPSGIMDLNLHFYDQPTLFDRLDEKQLIWKVYFGDIPVSLVLAHQWAPQNVVRHRPLLELYDDFKKESEVPNFVWIEPSYMPPTGNDYHPPHNVFRGEKLVADVYNALRANEELWNSSLFVVLFDEHGGFYDHLPPPTAIPPDDNHEEWTFNQLGVRVPAILVSPWVGNGVISDVFDHTSLLRYLTDKWGLGPLGARTANAKSFASVILSTCRTDTPKQLSVPTIEETQVIPEEMTEHEKALVSLSQLLESKAGEDASVIAQRSMQVLEGPSGQIKVALNRVEGFLHNQTSKI
ncbi:MAG: phospholipase [Thaumarchaeota archaeon]|nr:phospholipase [Nitrososphaerota archaeon]